LPIIAARLLSVKDANRDDGGQLTPYTRISDTTLEKSVLRGRLDLVGAARRFSGVQKCSIRLHAQDG